MKTTFVLKKIAKTNIIISTFLISIKNSFYTIFVVAMVTKFKKLYDFIAMETIFVLNNYPKTNIFISTFLISIQNGFYIIFDVAMVTKFRNLS